jgi:hypothetical protein
VNFITDRHVMLKLQIRGSTPPLPMRLHRRVLDSEHGKRCVLHVLKPLQEGLCHTCLSTTDIINMIAMGLA